MLKSIFTFKISGVKAFGPLEENDATRGAGCDPILAFEEKILDVALLFSDQNVRKY